MLSELCDHPYLSKQPVDMVICECHLFEGALLPELKGLSDWDGNEYKAREFELLHRSLYRSESAAEFFTNALLGLPNVKRVSLSHKYKRKCSTAKRIADYFGVEHCLRTCLRRSSLLEPVLSALLANNRTLTRLGVGSTGSGFWMRNANRWTEATRTTFSTLKEFTFNVGLIRNTMGIISSEVPISPKPSLVHKFLAAAPCLELLVLKSNNVDVSGKRQYVPRWDGAGVFDNVLWPQLHHLCIFGCKFKASNFTSFLLLNSGTLRHLELYNVELYESFAVPPGSTLWETFASCLAAKLNLRSVALINLFDQGQRRITTHYEAANRSGGIDTYGLILSWWNELSLYLLHSHGNPDWARFLPVYSQPRVLIGPFNYLPDKPLAQV